MPVLVKISKCLFDLGPRRTPRILFNRQSQKPRPTINHSVSLTVYLDQRTFRLVQRCLDVGLRFGGFAIGFWNRVGLLLRSIVLLSCGGIPIVVNPAAVEEE